MIDGSERRNRHSSFELRNSHVCEKRSNVLVSIHPTISRKWLYYKIFDGLQFVCWNSVRQNSICAVCSVSGLPLELN